jgi:hypothetical protein
MTTLSKDKASRACPGSWIGKAGLDRAVVWWLRTKTGEPVQHSSTATKRERAHAQAQGAVETATSLTCRLTIEKTWHPSTARRGRPSSRMVPRPSAWPQRRGEGHKCWSARCPGSAST